MISESPERELDRREYVEPPRHVITGLRHVWAVLRFVLPFLRPDWPIILVACLIVVAPAGLSTLTALGFAALLQYLLGGAEALELPQGGVSLLDLNSVGQQVLTRLWGWLPEPVGSQARVWLLLGLVGGLTLLTVITELAGQLLRVRVRLVAIRRMQIDLFSHLCGLSLGFFTRQKTGTLITRLYYDLTDLMTPVSAILFGVPRAAALSILSVLLLWNTNPRLTLITFVSAALFLVVSNQVGRFLKFRFAAKYDSFAELTAIVQETFLSIRVVKAFGAESHEVGEFSTEVRNYIWREFWHTLARNEILAFIAPLLSTLTAVAIALVGLQELLQGTITRPGLLMFIGVAGLLGYGVQRLGGALVDGYNAATASTRVLALWQVKPALVDGSREADDFQRDLVLREVTFSYGDENVLQDINLRIERGEVVALVGPSGAGKSTLTDLLLRLYDPTKGVVELDGMDVRQFSQASYRRLFGVVSQETLLFNDTVRNNIAYGRPELTEAAIIRAAKIANAHDFILELPQGYDTVVGDRGIRLSGGQRQRVAIARAIAHEPPILIFDEATSALDSESERLVQQAIEQAMRGRTVVVVAHRLSTVQSADRLVVLDRGRIVDIGNHAELLQRDGLYKKLYLLQFRGQTAEPAVWAEALA